MLLLCAGKFMGLQVAYYHHKHYYIPSNPTIDCFTTLIISVSE